MPSLVRDQDLNSAVEVKIKATTAKAFLRVLSSQFVLLSAVLISLRVLKANYPIGELQITSASAAKRPENLSSSVSSLAVIPVFPQRLLTTSRAQDIKKKSTHFHKAFNPACASKQAMQVNSVRLCFFPPSPLSPTFPHPFGSVFISASCGM